MKSEKSTKRPETTKKLNSTIEKRKQAKTNSKSNSSNKEFKPVYVPPIPDAFSSERKRGDNRPHPRTQLE